MISRNGKSGHGEAGLSDLDGFEGELCKSLNDRSLGNVGSQGVKGIGIGEIWDVTPVDGHTRTVEKSAVFCLASIRNKKKEYETGKEDYERFISKWSLNLFHSSSLSLHLALSISFQFLPVS